MVKDPEVCDPIRFLREREIVHFQRFGEALRNVQDHLSSRNFYTFNPEFDKVKAKVKDDKQPIDNILANVYQKIVLKLGEIQPLTAGEKKPKVVFFVGCPMGAVCERYRV